MGRKPTYEEFVRRMNQAEVIDSKWKSAAEYHQLGQLEKAEESYKEILEIHPRHADSLHQLGLISHETGDTVRAVDYITAAMENDPKNPIYHNNLGTILMEQGKLGEAITCFHKAIESKPGYAKAYYNMGITLKSDGRLEEAISCYKQALQSKPDYAEAHNNMGNTFMDLGAVEDAISCYRKAIESKPDYVEAYNNLGIALQDQGKPKEAIACYQKALRLSPDCPEVYNSMGVALQAEGRLKEAVACHKKALEINPNYAEACDNLIAQLQQMCAWRELPGLTANLDELTKEALEHGTKTGETAFLSLTRHADLSYNFAVARSWSSEIARSVSRLRAQLPFNRRRSHKQRIIIGYISSDFRDHPVAHLMISVFGLHDRRQFEVLCYSYGEGDRSSYRARIKNDSDKFVDVRNLSHHEVAKRIYEDCVDILVDLNGHTERSRLAICSFRPAPIQVTYLGFPGTTGAHFFDYIITDRIVAPEEHAIYYSESFVYMPQCYMVTDHTQAISAKGWQKADFGLPEESFVFCSFNNSYKIEPVMFDVWMQILQQVPESVLWLRQLDESAQTNLRLEAEGRGIGPERLVFAEKIPSKQEHLERLSLSNLALDTRIYNGHATTSDVLWAGVPVIALKGSHFASRASASLLTAIGLAELIVDSLQAYRDLAVYLASNPSELRAIRQKLSKNRLSEPLFDTPRFVRNLEKAYKEMWEIFLTGGKPRQIEVVES